MWFRVRVGALAPLVLSGLLAVGCTGQSRPATSGAVTLEGASGSLADVDCASVGDGTHARAAGTSDAGDRLWIEVSSAEGSGTVTVAEPGEDPQLRFVAADLTFGMEGDEIVGSGTFTRFEGAEPAGETSGDFELSCPPDDDPGGGFLVVSGRDVPYDLVTCVDRGDRYEVGARSVDGRDSLTLTRDRSGERWVDRIEATGTVQVSERMAVDDDAEVAADVAEGLFELRGARITIDEAVFAQGLAGSLDLTCGLEVEE